MNQFDRTSMEQATAVQHPAERKNGVLPWTETDSRKAACMRQARRKREGSAHRLTHVGLDAFQFCFDNLLNGYGDI